MAISRPMEAKLREAVEALDEAQKTRDDLIAEAWRKGGGIREIALVVGMSHVGVSAMLERQGVRKRWRSLEDANRELDRRDRAEREKRDK